MACNCGYWWADLDENGTPISVEYCHYDGPEGWAPCEQDEEPDGYWDEEPDDYWDWLLSGDYDEISDETLEAINNIEREF